MIENDPIETVNHCARSPIPRTIEHPHRHQSDPLGDAIGCATDGSGDMRTVAVTVLGSDQGWRKQCGDEASPDPPRELGVRAADAGIDDIGRDATARRDIRVATRQGQGALIDPVEAPRGRTGLIGVRRDHLVGFDTQNLRVTLQSSQRGRRQSSRKSVERARPLVIDFGAMHSFSGDPAMQPTLALELNDVAPRNRLTAHLRDGHAARWRCSDRKRSRDPNDRGPSDNNQRQNRRANAVSSGTYESPRHFIPPSPIPPHGGVIGMNAVQLNPHL